MNRVINSTYFPPGMHNTSTQRDLEAGIVHNAAGNHFYNADIDVDLINRSLAHVNNFAKRHTEKLPQVLMYEINSTGESCYKTITLRELLQYVNDETEPTTPESDNLPIPEMNSNRVLPPTGLKSYSTGTGTSSKQGGLRRSGSSSANLNQKEYARDRETPRQRQVEEHREQEPIAGRGYARSDFESVFDDAYNVIGELRLRDLRRLDFQFNPNEERSVLIRRHSVLFAMDPIRAVVMADRLILIVPDGADSLLSILDKYMKEWVLAKRAIEELNAEDTPYPGYNNNTNTIHAPHRFSDTANNITIKPSPGINNTNLDSSGTNTDTNTNGLGTLDDSAKLAHLLTTYNQTNTTNTTSTANAGTTTTTAPATMFDNTTIHPMHTPHNTPHTTTNTNTNTNTTTAHNYGAIPFPSSGTSSTNSSTSTTGSATYMLSPSTAPSTVHSAPFITSPLPPLPGQSGAGSAKAGGAGSGIGTGMGSGGVNSDFIDLESSTHALLTPSPPTCTSPPSKHQIQMLRKAISAAHELPFEVHAYEALLTTVMVLETQEFNRVNAQVQVILGYFRSGSLLPIEVQEQMRNRKNDLCVMLGRITSARNTINELTEDDEDMALMNLTLLKKKPKLYFHPLVPAILARHDEIEELLESYLIDFNALESKIEYVRSQIQNAEELLSLRLDTSRNELLIANTVLAILACCFGLGAYVSGIFGMNLDNTGKLQETKGVFNIVIAASTGAMILLFLGMVVVFKRNGMFPRRLALLDKDAAKFQ